MHEAPSQAAGGGDKGVFALAPIVSGERLAIFGGHVMSIVGDTLYLESGLDLSIQIDEGHSIGAACPEEIQDADNFNHSCDPNAGIKGQIILVAMRNIAAGEEVASDYATVLCGDGHPILAGYSFACTCGTPNCHGTVTTHDWRRPELRRRYRGRFSWYLQEKIDCEGWPD